jgi:hypothetical protein
MKGQASGSAVADIMVLLGRMIVDQTTITEKGVSLMEKNITSKFKRN